MTRLQLGVLCGIAFGLISAASMLPMKFPDKHAALLGAFFNRFAIGAFIGIACLPGWSGWMTGLFVGVLASLSDAIVTAAYIPILILGAVGGSLIGVVVQHFAH
jgi:hypothetical protein